MSAALSAEQRYSLRPFEANDLGLIRSSWRESHNVNGSRHKMPWRAWKSTHGRDMDAILALPGTRVLVATDAEAPMGADIAGWICWTPDKIPALHYLYVKHDYRGRKLASALFAATGIGSRLIYTFRGPRHRRDDEGVDVKLALRGQHRGVFASFVDAREFLR